MITLSKADYLTALFIFLTAAAISAISTPLVKRLAFKVGAVDQPSARRINTVPMPRMGGLAIYIGFVASLLIFTTPSKQILGTSSLKLTFRKSYSLLLELQEREVKYNHSSCKYRRSLMPA